MEETRVQQAHRLVALAFIAVATICLLSLVFALAYRGPAGWPGVLVYGFSAGFGLEYLGSAWASRFSALAT